MSNRLSLSGPSGNDIFICFGRFSSEISVYQHPKEREREREREREQVVRKEGLDRSV